MFAPVDNNDKIGKKCSNQFGLTYDSKLISTCMSHKPHNQIIAVLKAYAT